MTIRRAHRRRGWTLVEILVAMAILVILGVIAILVARGAVRSSKEKQTRLTMEVLVSALTVYKGERGQFPRDPYAPKETINTKLVQVPNGRKIDGNAGSGAFMAETVKFRTGSALGDYVKEDDPAEQSNWPVEGESTGHAFGEFAEHVTIMMTSAECKKALNRFEGSALGRRAATDGGTPPRDVWTVADAWGHEILYRICDHENNGFPILLSAGPDGEYSTPDDIRSDGKTMPQRTN